MIPHKNPLAPLQGSLIRVTPAAYRTSWYPFKEIGIHEPQFTALLVEAHDMPPSWSGGSFSIQILYKGSLINLFLFPNEVSPFP
jgi:hypothetical protein